MLVHAIGKAILFLTLLFGGAAVAHTPGTVPQRPAATVEPVSPVPLTLDLDPRKVTLGERLFNDPGLSRTGKMACVDCHFLHQGGADGLSYSIGVDGKPRARNTPSIFNVGLQPLQHWDGKYPDLKSQALASFPGTMQIGWDAALAYLRVDTAYQATFDQIYDDGIQSANVADATAAYEASLITPNARFDRYLRGDDGAISAVELHGYELFKSYGCVSCHNGVGVGGNMLAKFGHFGDYFEERGNITQADYARMNVTGREQDRYRFKVPSLRNVAITAPYFHDASAATLHAAIREVAKYQLGWPLPETDVDAIVAFLETLTGEFRGEPL